MEHARYAPCAGMTIRARWIAWRSRGDNERQAELAALAELVDLLGASVQAAADGELDPLEVAQIGAEAREAAEAIRELRTVRRARRRS